MLVRCRVTTARAAWFRRRATIVLVEYLVNGFALQDAMQFFKKHSGDSDVKGGSKPSGGGSKLPGWFEDPVSRAAHRMGG
ncbi:hypothetical protein ACFWN7_13590 [Agromyces sp. NPDC058484]|uniref:hypothetical protein n=1 Tax=Agromyces sp. NPDC058484 TaxID=3346524 RepID=UPI003655FC00